MQSGERIISSVTFETTNKAAPEIIAKLTSTLRDRLSVMRGFRESVLTINEAGNRVVIATEWISREDWAAAEWDQVVQHTVVEIFEATKSYEVEILYPLLRLTAAGQDEAP